MRAALTHRRLAHLAERTVDLGRQPGRGRVSMRDVADAASGDVRGLAVKVRVSTDPRDAPADCDPFNGGPLLATTDTQETTRDH